MSHENPIIRVLLVDDEINLLESTAKALRRRGMDVSTATNGVEAIQSAKILFFDVAVLDVNMPGMDGHHLFHALRAEQPWLQVLMLTGHGDIQKAFELGKTGLYDYLSKPIPLDELFLSIIDAYRKGAEGTEDTSHLEGVEDLRDPQSMRVLLVDDEADFLNSLSKVLARREMHPLTASNGEQALQLLSENRVDVVVCDVKMPGMDGVSLMQRIKEDDPFIEVILLTGHGNVTLAVEGMRKGAFDYLIKPQETEKFIRVVRAACHKKREHQRAKQEMRLKAMIENNPS